MNMKKTIISSSFALLLLTSCGEEKPDVNNKVDIVKDSTIIDRIEKIVRF